ncbi:EAL domain-containing protein [Lysobacter sp. TY2-98]|uniref:putative bifunctional diguanylate cyclase/phosphodiesterase n=1 Tax=Lysobacter sp. TY2-98 TaxID=2290922 RepID=UPI000E1FDD44|nr:EAL domain-containing protein [Lysobacter sp. TY2-98]AXK72817.1 EAL domain-containing protein [Lysobacter sp. TY2-98]
MSNRSGLRIEGTWLRSRLARRVFLMFCAMAFVPAALVFWLTWRQADRAIDTSEHRNVRAETRFVAFTVLSRLQSAEALLARIADLGGVYAPGETHLFDAVIQRPLDAGVAASMLPRLHVWTRPASHDTRVVLLTTRRRPDGLTTLYAGILSPHYLLHPDEDVVDGTRVCMHSGTQTVGCAGHVDNDARIMRDTWDLDLKAEFGAPAWRFESEHEHAAIPDLQVHWFALLAAGLLLMATLMSLVQIRRMLVPLEALMDRIRLFSGSRGPAGAARAPDELAALSTTFDDMQQRIGGQLARLRGLSTVDSGIVSRQSLDDILALVASELRALPGIADAAIVVELSTHGMRDVHLAGRSNGPLDHGTVLRLLDSPTLDAVDSAWQPIATQDGDSSGRDAPAYRLAIGESGEPHAWVVLLAHSATPSDETFDAARQLADRVSIALALDARERRLVHQSRHDALTDLPNRLAAIEALDAALAASSGPFAVVFMDLDRFKSVNDGLGHALGDGLLVEVAGRLRGALPHGDMVARFGGDEFVLLLHNVARAEDLEDIRARIDEALAVPVVLDSHVMALRYSAGVAFHPADGDNAHELVQKADVAMYRAKQDGGGRFAVYSPGMNEAAREEVELVAALRAALAANALDVYYQPRIDARTGARTGMEALARWHDPQRGWIPPARFVPLAERHGLIDALGAFVLHAACAHIAGWRAHGLQFGRVAINVSSEQLRAGTLVDDMGRVLDAMGAQWSDFEVEITESLLIADVETSARQLQALRELGVTVAIDDFGTGYSSLAYLARLPLDTIKIDRAFVVALEEAGTASVVKSILALATALGKRVITEGVETDAQLHVLQGWGCSVFQGYLFHRPMPAGDVQRLLESAAVAGTAV